MADGTVSLLYRLLGDSTDLQGAFKKSEKDADGFKDHLKGIGAVAGAAGTAAGGLLAAGFAQNLDISEANAKLAAQLGLGKDEAAELGKISGEIWAGNFGDNIDAVNEAVKTVTQNLGSVGDLGKAGFEKATEAALTLAQVTGADVNQTTEAAGKLIKNGLAKDSAEAFDIIAGGFQQGADRSGDFLDTLNEYAPQFSKLGITGGGALSLLQAGLKAGARDTDTIADAFKEFSLRSIDGSKLTADGFKAVGLDAGQMAAKIAAGGPAAAGATEKTLQALARMKDPVKQNAAGVALFGTQWEDTLRQILPALTEVDVMSDTTTGSIDQMTAAVGGTGKARIETFTRSVQQWIQQQSSGTGVMAVAVAGLGTYGATALEAGGQLGMMASGLSALNVGTLASRAATLATTAATSLWTGAQWLLNAALTANPIGIIIVAIVALVAAIIIAYKKSETFRAIVHAALGGVAAAFRFLLGVGRSVISGILAGWHGLTSGISGAWSGIVGFIRSIPGRILGALGNLGNLLKNAGRDVVMGFLHGIEGAWHSVISKLSDLTSKIPGPVRSVLGIHSPSTVFAEIGQQTMKGFEVGLVDGFDGVHGQLGGLTQSLPGAVGAGPAGGAGAVHVHTPAVITSDRDLIRLVDQARSRSVRAGTFVPVATTA